MKPVLTEEFEMALRDFNIRLEVVNGIPVWESPYTLLHQEAVARIRRTIAATQGQGGSCGCIQVSDLSMCFPDGSQKRPDIVIFCREWEELETEVTVLPDAVIEVLSEGFEAKDTVIGVPFYLAQGVKDIVLFDPRTNLVTHVRHDSHTEHTSPVEIVFECGGCCTV